MEKFLIEDIKNTWISDSESEEDISKNFEIINTEMEKVYQFVLNYSEYLYIKRDYGHNLEYTMLEIHVLTDICDNPGITATDIAKKWGRTTSSISQMVKTFYDQKLIRRVRNKSDGKVNNLYITEKGKEIVLTHKHYDNIDAIKTLKHLRKKFSMEELRAFFMVAEEYARIMNFGEKVNKNTEI